MSSERKLSSVPWAVSGVLVIALGLQIATASMRAPPRLRIAAVAAPPPVTVLRTLALGQPEVLAKVLMLWLQAHDYQPGVSVAFRDLDYERVEAWLDRMLALDADFHYPLLAASRLYAEVGEPTKQRRMLEFVGAKFVEDPGARWPWMAHAVYIAKHRLDDLDYALELARALAATSPAAAIPGWATQMHIFVLEDMGELEAAKVLLGGLLESGQISDPHEQWFLTDRLQQLEARTDESADGPR